MLSVKYISLAILLAVAPAGFVRADVKPVKANKTWKGSVKDRSLEKLSPGDLANAGVITKAKDFEKLIKAWKVAEKVPEVDFDKEIVIVNTSWCNAFEFGAQLDEKGDLKIRDAFGLGESGGFRYYIVTVARAGVRTVNGKELPK